MLEVISLHVPKCAGSSLKSTLQDAFGPQSVYEDYADRPLDPASPLRRDPAAFFAAAEAAGCAHLDGKRVVHGHFHALKYAKLPCRHRITFLREPVDRLISHYFFWKTLGRHGHSLHDYFLDHQLDIEQFAQLPVIRTAYSESFFGGADMRAFDFIGFCDDYERDLARLAARLGAALRPTHANPTATGGYPEERRAILENRPLLARLRAILRDDIEFYEGLRAARRPGR
jgi:hypothetical protein